MNKQCSHYVGLQFFLQNTILNCKRTEFLLNKICFLIYYHVVNIPKLMTDIFFYR